MGSPARAEPERGSSVSNAALTPRQSALPDVPSRNDLEALSPADLWTLEERATEIQGACRELNDERLHHWVEVEGKTYADIARIVGRSRQAIQQRGSRLGLQSPDRRGGERSFDKPPLSNEEVIDAEVVEDDPGTRPAPQGGLPATPSQPSPAVADPGPRVKCPTCGAMWKPGDIGAWQ